MVGRGNACNFETRFGPRNKHGYGRNSRATDKWPQSSTGIEETARGARRSSRNPGWDRRGSMPASQSRMGRDNYGHSPARRFGSNRQLRYAEVRKVAGRGANELLAWVAAFGALSVRGPSVNSMKRYRDGLRVWPCSRPVSKATPPVEDPFNSEIARKA
jgi:hypothetical protein